MRKTAKLICTGFFLAFIAPLPATTAQKASTNDPVAEFLDDSYSSLADKDNLEGRLYRWAKAGATLDQLIANTAREYGIESKLASEFVTLAMRSRAVRMRDEGDAEQQEMLERWQELAKANPGTLLAYEEAARGIDELNNCDGEALDRLVMVWPKPDEMRLRLYSLTQCMPLLSVRTSEQTGSAEVHLRFAKTLSAWDKAPLVLAVLRVADKKAANDANADINLWAEIRVQRLRRELLERQFEEAIAAIPAESDALYRPVLDALTAFDRLDLTAALLLANQTEKAEQWRKLAIAVSDQAVIPGGTESAGAYFGDLSAEEKAEIDAAREKSNKRDEQVQRQFFADKLALLSFAFGENKSDAFTVLMASDPEGMSAIGSAFFKGPWDALSLRVAEQQGYSSVKPRRYPNDAHDYGAAYSRETCYRCSTELLSAIDAVSAALMKENVSDDDRKASADLLPSGVLTMMDKAIVAPAKKWPVHALPEKLKTRRTVKKETGCGELCLANSGEEVAKPSWAKRLPPGELVRWQLVGKRLIAITASQSLDPVGEISSGAYWISISNDAGANFEEPMYTGLQVFSPYVIRPDSKLALFHGDTLQPEVSVRELDTRRVSFPPIDLPVKRQQDDLYLEIPLADLARDSDHDGLTDMVEQAMLLDKDNADSDGDGINDGTDKLPNVPHAMNASNGKSEALAAALNQIFGKSLGAIVTTSAHVSGANPEHASAVGTGTDSRNYHGAIFLIAPASGFANIDLRERTILLNQSQRAKLTNIKGQFLPFQITVFAINRDGTEGVLQWTAGWTGGSFKLHKRKGVWVVEENSRWIT